jgi:hypothetical protein
MAGSPWMKNLRKAMGIKRTQCLEYQKTLTSAITANFAVYWNEDNIARDLMQNFYDANRGSLSEVKVKVQGNGVTISGPTAFNLERLFYLGSEKGEDEVGEYGEGFKVAILNLLRDHQVEVVAVSGDRCVHIRLSEETVAETELRPMVYDFYHLPKLFAGSVLLLGGCSDELTKTLESGLDHFLYPENPLLGEELWSSPGENFIIYRSRDTVGYVFYRNQRRGTITGIPLVLVINKPFKAMETLTQKDRDRKDFENNKDILITYFQVFVRELTRLAGPRVYNAKDARRAIISIVSAARECWVGGHPLLSKLASSCQQYHDRKLRSTWSSEETRDMFGDRFFARSSSRDKLDMPEYKRLEEEWASQWRTGLPGYFRYFGVISAEIHLYDLRKTVAMEHQRAPTAAENNGIDVLWATLGTLSPELTRDLAQMDKTYFVIDSQEILGALKEYRGYRSVEVLLEQGVFESGFGDALATFLHEHAHIRGSDGSSYFTDALTALLGSLVRQRKSLDAYEERWNACRTEVSRERLSLQSQDRNVTDSSRYIASIMEPHHLAEVLDKIPLQGLDSIVRPILVRRMVSVLKMAA